jgi:hypothetical protein
MRRGTVSGEDIMTGFRSNMLMAIVVAAGTLITVSPSYAFVAWACTAKDSHGVKSTYEYHGLFTFDSKLSAASFAKAACEAKSKSPATCHITTCWMTHA